MWRPIDTAPKDGSCGILLWGPELGKRFVVGWWSKRSEHWYVDAWEPSPYDNPPPTHWCEIPAPPVVDGT